jgi:hypothetical protein
MGKVILFFWFLGDGFVARMGGEARNTRLMALVFGLAG